MRSLAKIVMFALGGAGALCAADVGELAGMLRDPKATVTAKGEACVQLMDLGPAAAPAVPALIPLLEADDELLRDYAVTTLSKIGAAASAALPALRHTASKDASAEIRSLATDAIGKIGGGTAPASEQRAAAVRPAPNASTPKPVATAVPSGSRPPLAVKQGHYFRWAVPAGWADEESANGVTLTAPDGVMSVSSVILMRSPGMMTPANFAVRMLSSLPGITDVRLLNVRDQPGQPSGLGPPWQVQEVDASYSVNGMPARATWTVGIVGVFGSFDTFMLGYQAPVEAFEAAKLWLAPIAQSVAITNPREVAGNDQVIPPKNHPLDNSGLLESWRQKGLSEDRISKARREGTMGYERAKDPATGRVYEMPLETWDGTVGGYRNPARPTEILQPTNPQE